MNTDINIPIKSVLFDGFGYKLNARWKHKPFFGYSRKLPKILEKNKNSKYRLPLFLGSTKCKEHNVWLGFIDVDYHCRSEEIIESIKEYLPNDVLKFKSASGNSKLCFKYYHQTNPKKDIADILKQFNVPKHLIQELDLSPGGSTGCYLTLESLELFQNELPLMSPINGFIVDSNKLEEGEGEQIDYIFENDIPVIPSLAPATKKKVENKKEWKGFIEYKGELPKFACSLLFNAKKHKKAFEKFLRIILGTKRSLEGRLDLPQDFIGTYLKVSGQTVNNWIAELRQYGLDTIRKVWIAGEQAYTYVATSVLEDCLVTIYGGANNTYILIKRNPPNFIPDHKWTDTFTDWWFKLREKFLDWVITLPNLNKNRIEKAIGVDKNYRKYAKLPEICYDHFRFLAI